MLGSDEEFSAKLVEKMKNIPSHVDIQTNICLDGLLGTDVCLRAYSLQDVFVLAGWSSLWAFHQTEREREWKKERKRERDRNTENERTHWDKLITSGLVSLSYASESTEVFCLADCVWMRCVQSQNTHRCSYFPKWMGCNHINAQDGCGVFL